MDKHDSQNNPEMSSWSPPRHWIAPEELEASYWSDTKIQEKRGQEFLEKPIEYLEKLDASAQGGMARRDFLTIMGASMAMASFACARRPVHKIIPYVVKPEEITPGIANFYSSTCQECSNGCGILAKTREGRPIKLEGNPDHPINKGSLCARGQASLLNLYDPERLKAPIFRSRSSKAEKELSWEALDSELVEHWKKIANGSGRVRVLSGSIGGISSQRLIQDFLGAFKNGRWIEFEPVQFGEIAEAQALSYGSSLVPHYRFDKADYVLSLGADFLGNWLSPLEHSHQWVQKRKLEGQRVARAQVSKLVCFEPMMSLTGSNADLRYSVRPGEELSVALSLAHELIVKQKVSEFSHHEGLIEALSSYSIEKVASDLGMENSHSLKKLAEELWLHRGKSLVVAGSLQTKDKNAVALQVAVNLLNSVLGNEGVTVDGTFRYSSSPSQLSDFYQLVSDMEAGQVDAIILYRTNPIYSFPKSQFEAALAKVPLVIAVTDRLDETALYADYILPDSHYLENWGDAHPRNGLYSLQQPVIAPMHSTRAFQDSLITWGKKAHLSMGSLSAQSEDWHQYLKGSWKETLFPQVKTGGSFDLFWEGSLRSGVLNLHSAQSKLSTEPQARRFDSGSLKSLPQSNSVSKNPITLALYAKLSMFDGRSANNAWLQEMPDPLSSVTWDNYLNISPSLAKKLGLKNNEVVKITSNDSFAELPVFIQPGMHPAVVSAAIGYGRRASGKVGNGAGVDLYPFVEKTSRGVIYSGHGVEIKKTGKFYRLASTQWHTATENRPIINDITLDEYRHNPQTANHTDPHLRENNHSLWPKHDFPGYRWGMSIDLNSCIGCAACVIACQAENNIPVVGRDQVRNSRIMHWIRIDRYFSQTVDTPDVVFQPMLCQHCENAPCETVCPVLATVHDDEGLNVQVYNRCVGTRYCQNNCPYKVRRFNFFDHWKSYKDEMNLIWNPDVTVRTRGIMEKCTFCTQRIRDAKDHAKDLDDRVKDGDLKTACQQTCPTNAIVFGDINDATSKVSQLSSSPRSFRVLESLNTKPSISYLTKVRNKPQSHRAGHE